MSRVPRPVTRQTTLGDLITGLADAQVIGDAATVVTGIELDSRRIEPGDLFAALPGHLTHGAHFIPQAVARGAVAILTDDVGAPEVVTSGLPVLAIAEPRAVLGTLSARLFGDPSSALTVLGVTGTNGKTTVTYMLEAGLQAAGRTTGVIGTIGIRIGHEVIPGERTTPESVHLQALLARMRDDGVQSVAMEVSSHALCEGRVDALRFASVGFTNLSQDHLDYHGTMEDYFLAKAQLFTPDRAARGVVGVDDAWGRRLAEMATIPITTWTTRSDVDADWRIVDAATGWEVHGPSGEVQSLRVPIPGDYNRANALCAYAMLRSIGLDGADIARGIASVRVPGRMEVVAAVGDVTGIVDYAHTPDAIERAILAARETCPGRLIVVVGAGGDRDRAKRPLMGEVAARLADCVIVTDDNPRSEDPSAIRAAVLEGIGSTASEIRHVPDRRAAIADAVSMTRPGDTVLVLGKGHEQGQEIAGIVHPFDDRDELRNAMNGRA